MHPERFAGANVYLMNLPRRAENGKWGDAIFFHVFSHYFHSHNALCVLGIF
jgi:hypothetical protein